MRHGRIARLAAWCMIIAAVAASGARAGAQTPRNDDALADGGAVIPDSGGRISELLLFFDPTMESELDPLYTDLFGALGDNVLIRVICPNPAAGARFSGHWGAMALAGGREVEVVSVGLPLTIWARDRCIARQSRSLLRRASYFVPASESDYPDEKRNDRMVQALLSLAGLLPGMYSSPLQLEGGNVVANSKHVFVGANVIEENPTLHRAGKLPGELRRLFGKPYVLVGDVNGAVPWCHVDMYLTPLDDRTVLVGSPLLGDRLLKQAALSGDEQAAALLQQIEIAAEVEPIYDAAVESVAAKGYRVLRAPLVTDAVGDWMITYSNVLLERRDGKRVAYVPQYHVPALDAAGLALYEGLGFEVHGIDVSGVYDLGGAIRCVANVTQRSPDRSTTSRTPRNRRTRRAAVTMINLATNFTGEIDDCSEDDDAFELLDEDALAPPNPPVIDSSAGCPSTVAAPIGLHGG